MVAQRKSAPSARKPAPPPQQEKQPVDPPQQEKQPVDPPTAVIRADEVLGVNAFRERLGLSRNMWFALKRAGLPVHCLSRNRQVVVGKEYIEWCLTRPASLRSAALP